MLHFALGSAVFGFIGAFKVKSDGPKVKTLGVCFIVLGGLQVFTIHGILFLIAGILTITKKEYKTNSKEDEGTKMGMITFLPIFFIFAIF